VCICFFWLQLISGRIAKLPFVQKLLWENAGFNSLRKIEHLNDYTERWNPTVIPLNNLSVQPPAKLELEAFPVLPEKLPGRYRSATELHTLYLSGELTPLSVVESLLPLIRRDVASKSHHSASFISCNFEDVLEAAKASTLRYQNGSPLSILDGVPTAVKDESDVAGYRTTNGRKANDAIFPIATETIWPVKQWIDAGAIILGKTTMHEIGAGKHMTYLRMHFKFRID
jgi:hypothetical protein